MLISFKVCDNLIKLRWLTSLSDWNTLNILSGRHSKHPELRAPVDSSRILLRPVPTANSDYSGRYPPANIPAPDTTCIETSLDFTNVALEAQYVCCVLSRQLSLVVSKFLVFFVTHCACLVDECALKQELKSEQSLLTLETLYLQLHLRSTLIIIATAVFCFSFCREMPSCLEYFSYIFYFQAVLVGPLSFFGDYKAFIEGKDLKQKQIDSPVSYFYTVNSALTS